MPHKKAIRDSTAGARAQSACMRACDDYDKVTELAHAVSDDLDQLTIPGAVAVEIHEESSIVTVLQEAIDAHDALKRS